MKTNNNFQSKVKSSLVATLAFAALAGLAPTSYACQSSHASSQDKTEEVSKKSFAVQTITASEAGFLVNSHLITGSSEAVLIDAQFTESDSQTVIDEIRKSGKNLTTILVTHAHPDHYFGLTKILKAFPKAKAVTSERIRSEILETKDSKLSYWKEIYKENLTDVVSIPEGLGDEFKVLLDDTVINVESITNAEAETHLVARVPGHNALFMGDLLYNEVHLWLAEGRPSEWKMVLQNFLPELNQQTRVFPGHGKEGKAELFAENISYIDRFVDVVKISENKKEALELFKTSPYSNYGLPIILDISLDAAFAER